MKASLDSIPNEILAIIEAELHLEDVASLVLSCQSLNAALTPLLYRRGSGHVEVTLWAAARGEVGVLEKLFDAGADLDKKSSWKAGICSLQGKPDLWNSSTLDAVQDKPSTKFSLQHTLHTQSYYRFQDDDSSFYSSVHTLEYAYSKPDTESESEFVIECQPKTLTALTLAAKMGHEQVIDFLLQHGASINQRCRQICYCEHMRSATSLINMPDSKPDYWCEYEWTPLHLAIHHGHLRSAKKLMASGASFEASGCGGLIPSMTNALDIASAAGDTAIFTAVFDHFASSINQLHKRDALDFAYIHGSMDVFHLLLDRGIEIDDPATLPHSNGTTILMEACASEYFTDAFWLLELGADASKVTDKKMTALNCLTGRLDKMKRGFDYYTNKSLWIEGSLPDLLATMELLLENGADPNTCFNTGGRSWSRLGAGLPLVTAAEWCQIDMITLLLDYNADIDACDQHSYSPLWAASLSKMPAQNMVATMTLLIERGAYVLWEDEENGQTILDKIAQHHNEARVNFAALVSLILDCGLTPKAGLRGDTWIKSYFYRGQIECSKLLAEHGAPEPDSQVIMEMLTHAIVKNSAEAMRFVLALKSMEKHPIAKSHLDHAVKWNKTQVTHLLLEHDAPWTHISRDEWSRLLLACDFVVTRDVRIHTLLLERGADPNTMLGGFGLDTPLQMAIFWDNLPLVQTLLDHGADLNLKGKDVTSPMENAESYKSFDILKLLLEYSGVKGKVRRRWKSRIYNGLAKLKKAGGPTTDAS